MSLRLYQIPIDLMKEILVYLSTDSVAQLWSTLDRRIQLSLLRVGFSSSLSFISPLKSSQGPISYLLRSLPSLESVLLDSNYELSKAALFALSDYRSLHTLEVHRMFFDVWAHVWKNSQAFDPLERQIPLLKVGSFVSLNWAALFPNLESLSLLSPLNPIIYEIGSITKDLPLTYDRNEALLLALQNFPANLIKLHLVLQHATETTTVEMMKLLPVTLSDLYIDHDGALSKTDHYLDTAVRFPHLKRLRLFHQTYLSPVFYSTAQRTAGMKLEELYLSSFPSIRYAIGPLYLQPDLNHLHTLSVWLDKAGRSHLGSTPLDAKLRWPALRTLKLFRISRHPRDSLEPCPIINLPVNVTHLEVSAATGVDISNFPMLTTLVSTPFLTTLIELNTNTQEADPIPWEILPKTLTRIEMQGFGLVEHRIDSTRSKPINPGSEYLYEPLNENELLVHMSMAPPGLQHLKCPISSFRYLYALRTLHPDCYIEDAWYHRSKPSFNSQSWEKLEQLGCFDNFQDISEKSIIDFILTQLGPRTKVNLTMDTQAGTFYKARHELVRSFQIGALPISKLNISMDFGSVSPLILLQYPRLTSLDIGTRFELNPALLPNSLVSLHLRYSAISVALLTKCFEIESLTSLRAHGKVANTEISGKKVKNWKIFDLPQLTAGVKRLPSFFSSSLEELSLMVFSLPDTDLDRLMELVSPTAKIYISCTLLITGKLIDASCEELTYPTLINMSCGRFLPRGVTITDISMKNLWLPDGPVSLIFDNNDLPSHVSVRSELFRRFPATLKRLVLRNTGFEISWRKLSQSLPAGLEHFLCAPSKEVHDLDQIPPLKSLKTLCLEWPSASDGASLTPLAFDLSPMESLTCLELVNLQATYPLREITQALANLQKIRIPTIDDCDIHTVFCGHPNIESVQVDTLNLSGACLPETKTLDWPYFVEGSLSVVLPIVKYKRIMLAQPISFAISSVEEICFHHTSSEAYMEKKPEIAEQILKSDFMIFQTEFPPLLTRLDFSSASAQDVSWSKCLSVLSKAVSLKWVKLDMPIDLTIEASYPLLPRQLSSLILPLAHSNKKGGSGLLLPQSLTELYAPKLYVNPETHPLPTLEKIDVANVEYVKRMRGYAEAAALTSNQKDKRSTRN